MGELLALMAEITMADAKEAVAKNVEVKSLLSLVGEIAPAFGWTMKEVLLDPQKLAKCKQAIANVKTI